MPAQQQLAPLRRQAAAAHHGTPGVGAQLSEEANHQVVKAYSPMAATAHPGSLAGQCMFNFNKQTNILGAATAKRLLGRNDQTHHRMDPKTTDSTPPTKRNTQAYSQLRYCKQCVLKRITKRSLPQVAI